MRVQLLCVLLTWLGRVRCSDGSRHHHETRLAFRNEWTVKVDGGASEVQQVADQLGLHNAGPLKGLSHVYRLVKTNHPESSADAADHITARLAAQPKVLWVEQQFSKQRSKRGHAVNYNDPSWNKEWYISRRNGRLRSVASEPQNSMNLLQVMEQGVTGRGVGVVIIDDGVEYNNTDIAHAYDPSLSYDVVDGDRDPAPRYDEVDTNAHGTKCAGIVSMQPNNDFCGVGMATGARLGAVRLLDGVITDRTEGEAFSAACLSADIISVSWGPTDSGYIADMPGRLLQDAIETCVQQGRHSRGVILVWASGNGGGDADDNCACDGYASSMFTLSVGSVDQEGRMPWYGEICSSTMAVTYTVGHPDNVITTAMHDGCTSGFSGTSASAPMAASMVALMLEVNPKLSWREVQHIVVYTSRPEPVLRANREWHTNAVRLRYNTRVGFGLMDAAALVAAARTWNSSLSANVSRRYCQAEAQKSAERRQLSSSTPVKVSFLASCDGLHQVRHLEHAELLLSLNYSRRGALSMRLTSPQGTTVTILRPRRKDDSADGFDGFKLMSVATWGENPHGKWTLEVRDDTNEPNYGELEKMKLILWGTEEPIHPMTAQPAPEMSGQDEMNTLESSGAAETQEPGENIVDPTEVEEILSENVGSLAKNGDEPITNIGRHTEFENDPTAKIGGFMEFVETPNGNVGRFTEVGEVSKEGSGRFGELEPEPADDIELVAEIGEAPFVDLGQYAELGGRPGENIGRFAELGKRPGGNIGRFAELGKRPGGNIGRLAELGKRPGGNIGRLAEFGERPGGNIGRLAEFGERPGGNIGRFAEFGERPGGNIGRLAEFGAAWSGDRPGSLSEVERIVPETLNRIGTALRIEEAALSRTKRRNWATLV